MTVRPALRIRRGSLSRIFKVENSKGSGTGFTIVTPSGKIRVITNAHVCGADKFLLMEFDKKSEILVVRKVSKEYDLCLMGTNLNIAFKLAVLQNLGSNVVVEGFPLGLHKINTGRLEEYHLYQTPDKEYHASLSYSNTCDYGSSGSPIVNMEGEVVGVINKIVLETKQGIGIPLIFLKDFLEGE